MCLIMYQKRAMRIASLKAVMHATQLHPRACETFVEKGQLRTVFGIFMGRNKLKKQSVGECSYWSGA